MENMNHEIPSLRELREMRKPIRNIKIEQKNKLSGLEKFALWITEHIGTMGFFLLIFSWTLLWLLWNVFAPRALQFDPFPAFVLWLFISNMIQLFFLPLILIGQNLEGRHSEARAEADYEINTKAEREIEAVLMHLENQNELILKILSRLKDKK